MAVKGHEPCPMLAELICEKLGVDTAGDSVAEEHHYRVCYLTSYQCPDPIESRTFEVGSRVSCVLDLFDHLVTVL